VKPQSEQNDIYCVEWEEPCYWTAKA